MEMKVDSRLIRTEREKRAWSQEHLARLAGLGLRTIQRIEASGLASYESISAISSVLEIPVADLRVELQAKAYRSSLYIAPRKAIAAVAVLCAVVVSAFVTRTVVAEQIMLDVGISLNGDAAGNGRLVTAEGKDAEILIEDVLRFVVVPTITEDGLILLSTEVHMFDGSLYNLVSEPKVATSFEKLAEIKFGTSSGDLVRFLITPHAH